jgi:predicted chitinase
MKTTLLPVKFMLVLLPLTLLMSFNCSSNKTKNKPTNAPLNLLTEKQFNDLFPRRSQFYTYTAFVKAINALSKISVKVDRRSVSFYQYTRTDKVTGKSAIVRQDEEWNEDWAKKKGDSIYTVNYSDFCTAADAQTNRKELAAFLAQIAHETRFGENGKYNDGLIFIHEKDTSNSYLADNDAYPPVAGKKYYGRGPIQLSYNGNYGKASNFIFGDKNILLKNPALIEKDAVVAFETAIWFWMTPDTHKPSAHDVMIGKWHPNPADKASGRTPGFGMTINIINGPIECNKGENVFSMNDRIGFYQYFLKQLGATDPNCTCSCGKMQPYHY